MNDTDLQAILAEYADRNGTPYIESQAFYKDLAQHALHRAQKDRSWEVWTKRPREKFESDLKALVVSGVCSIQNTSGKEFIYLPEFFVARVRFAWTNIEKQEKNIFPSEKQIKFSPPADVLKHITEKEIVKFLREDHASDIPIIKYTFANNLGSTFFLAAFSESRLLDAAISKMRLFLVSKDNRGFCLTRIRSVFPDRFMQANTIMDLIVKNPIGCIKYMRDGNEDAFIMWIKLCEFINEMCGSETTPPTEADIAVRQSTEFIKAYNNYYRELAADKGEKESLLDDLYTRLSAPPYFWKFTDIYKVQVKNNKPIIESVKHEVISEYILKHTHDADDSIALPPLVIFYDEFKEKRFIKKEVVFTAFNALISDSRKEIMSYIHKRWYKIMKKYGSEPAMKNDLAFEALLIKVIKQLKPFVTILHQDAKLRLLQKEFAAPGSEYSKMFLNGDIKQLGELYNIDRRHIIKDVQLSLPVWHSIPVLIGIIRFFKGKQEHEDEDE